jgi:hypothetical protein
MFGLIVFASYMLDGGLQMSGSRREHSGSFIRNCLIEFCARATTHIDKTAPPIFQHTVKHPYTLVLLFRGFHDGCLAR